MLIEQIIEFELKGPGPPGRTYQIKVSKLIHNFLLDVYL